MELSNKSADLIGAVTAILFFASAILVFSFRLAGNKQAEWWLGIFELCLAVPLVILLVRAPALRRPAIYYIQICCILLWMIAELFLDYILKFDFRQIRWMVISYVMLFFAGAGGLLGIAVRAGRGWSIASIALFLIMTAMTFVQRAITGK